jgi:hypothetical protein
MTDVPKMSRESAAEIDDLGPGEDRHGELSGYTVSFVTVRQHLDLAPLLKGLPDDLCHRPHWGYMFKGKQTVRCKDHEEVFEAGDAFYRPPGHAPAAAAGSEFLIMSPTDELAKTQVVMQRNAQEMQRAPR